MIVVLETIALFLLALLLCLAAVPGVRWAAARFGLLDQPDSERKRHARPVPRLGGVAVMFAYASALALLLVPGIAAAVPVEQVGLPARLLPAVLIVFATGLLDDLRGLRPWQKLAAQLVAALLVCQAGVQVTGVVGYQFPPMFAVPLTVLWLMLCSNAFNLIDGLDGLAAGLGLSATITMLVAGFIHRDFSLVLATAPLAGALLGFLRYNFNPASIFLGDSGSLTIGFLLGCLGVIYSQKAATLIGMSAPIMALAIPLLDTLLAVARRLLRGEHPFKPDYGHMHHRLLAMGFSHRGTALMLYSFCVVAAGLSVLENVTRGHLATAVLLVFFVSAWLAVQWIGFHEFSAARDVLFGGTVRRLLRGQVELAHLRENLQNARSLEECWRFMCRAGAALEFPRIRMNVGSRHFDAGRPDWIGAGCWTLRIALTKTDSVELAVDSCSQHQLMAAGGFAAAIRDALQPRVRELDPREATVPSRVVARAG